MSWNGIVRLFSSRLDLEHPSSLRRSISVHSQPTGKKRRCWLGGMMWQKAGGVCDGTDTLSDHRRKEFVALASGI